MTREKAMEIEGMLDEGGKIDREGYISGCSIWTPTIEKMIKKGAGIFFNGDKGKMQIDNWPLDVEPKAVVEFKGFGGENMELRITRTHTEPDYRDHDHIEIWKDGKRLKYMHILKDGDVDVF